MSNHTKEPWLCEKRTGHALNPQTASTVQGGVVSPQVRCDNCNTVVAQGEAKTLFCSGEINGVPRHVISLCPSCVPTKKRRKFGMKLNHNNAVSELVTAVEKLLGDVDPHAPEGFLQECLNSGRLVSVAPKEVEKGGAA